MKKENIYSLFIPSSEQANEVESLVCCSRQQMMHAEDQAPLFANRQYKDAWFYKKDVLKHAERTYHPGE